MQILAGSPLFVPKEIMIRSKVNRSNVLSNYFPSKVHGFPVQSFYWHPITAAPKLFSFLGSSAIPSSMAAQRNKQYSSMK
mmetsp:Transcript_13486/g.20527  ORF Transcript_13486/g.20527 Transcript_13486/m.20527 type:complete len:80 (-) Transcript_13486:4-243(-)